MLIQAAYGQLKDGLFNNINFASLSYLSNLKGNFILHIINT